MARKYVGLVTIVCERCGKEAVRRASQVKNPERTFCSRDCYVASDYYAANRDAANARRYAGKRESHPCLACGAAVERPVSQFNERVFCSRDCWRTEFRTRAHKQVTKNGYIRVFVGRGEPGADVSGHILEHRLVMQQHLGRTLHQHETVHHMNGNRADNRLENLELWSSWHPYGQRIEDKIAWAREFLAAYQT